LPARLAFLICSITLLASCTKENEAARTDTAAAAAAAPTVVRLAASEYAFDAPDTIAAGWTTFRLANRGQEVHYGHIVRLDSGRTVKELVDAYAEAIRTSGPRPKWVTRFGGPGGTFPADSSSVTQHLEPGSYVWICPVEDEKGNPHFGKGEFKQFVVRASEPGAADRAAAPTAAAVIRLADFSFASDAPLVAGRQVVRVVNDGKEPHDLVIFKLAPGKTADDLMMALNPERARRPGEKDVPPPPLETLGTGAGGIAAIRSGMEVFFDADFTSGEYVMLCMATAPDGRSHIEHGMVRQVTVAARE
jgi:hypothetical protein